MEIRRWVLSWRKCALGVVHLKVIAGPQSLPHSLLPVHHEVKELLYSGLLMP
jgi:hypothetical protein